MNKQEILESARKLKQKAIERVERSSDEATKAEYRELSEWIQEQIDLIEKEGEKNAD